LSNPKIKKSLKTVFLKTIRLVFLIKNYPKESFFSRGILCFCFFSSSPSCTETGFGRSSHRWNAVTIADRHRRCRRFTKSTGERLRCSTMLFCDLLVLRKAQGGRRRHKPCDPTLFTITAPSVKILTGSRGLSPLAESRGSASGGFPKGSALWQGHRGSAPDHLKKRSLLTLIYAFLFVQNML